MSDGTLLLFLLFPLLVSSQQILQELQIKAESTNFTLSDPLDDFTRNTFASLVNGSSDSNFVFSPFSLHTALSMLYYGSPEISETHRQLAKVLGLSSGVDPSRNYLLNYLLLNTNYEKKNSYVRSANKIFVDSSVRLEEDYQSVMRLFYRAKPASLALADGQSAARIINDFVASKTNGALKELVSPGDIDEFTRILLINALHFKGDWKTKFSKSGTRSGTFRTLYRGPITHPKMMRTTGAFWVSLNSSDFAGADVIELPYENENYSMTLFVAPDSSLDSINKVLSSVVNTKDLSRKSSDRLYPLKINLVMPKFVTESSKKLTGIFKNLGVTDVFDKNKADLRDMAENYRNLHVDEILHKAQIEVDEEGSEAVAATAVVIGTRSSQVREPIPLVVDRPFLFLITDKKYRVPLFFGIITDPSNGKVSQRQSQVRRPPRTGRVICNDFDGRGRIIFPCNRF